VPKRHTFAAEETNLEEACRALRWFTLAGPGSTRKSGLKAIAKVKAVCERMNALFSKGPDALRLASLQNTVRGKILAAEARLALLMHKGDATREVS